eukprot:364749-Chlamydomonas_euryale.AAC.5
MQTIAFRPERLRMLALHTVDGDEEANRVSLPSDSDGSLGPAGARRAPRLSAFQNDSSHETERRYGWKAATEASWDALAASDEALMCGVARYSCWPFVVICIHTHLESLPCRTIQDLPNSDQHGNVQILMNACHTTDPIQMTTARTYSLSTFLLAKNPEGNDMIWARMSIATAMHSSHDSCECHAFLTHT